MALEPPLAATTHLLVGHLLREIESSLGKVIEPLRGAALEAARALIVSATGRKHYVDLDLAMLDARRSRCGPLGTR